MDYTTLTGLKTVTGSIKEWVNDGTIPASVVLQEAEQMIFTELRVREQKKLYSGTVASGNTTLDLDTVAPRFLEAISFRRAADAAGRIFLRDEQYFEERLATQSDGTLFAGCPTECCIDSDTIYFNVSTDQTYYLRLWYFERPAPLAASTNETNFLTDKHPMLLRNACLAAAFDFKKDSAQRDHHLKMMASLIQQANVQADIQKQAYDEDIYSEGAR